MPITIYPLDKTGVNPNNLIINEPHTLSTRAIRAIAPANGAFFTESIQIVDNANNITLNTTQWYAGELLSIPTSLTGKAINSLIIITDVNVSSNVTIRYQCIGGEFSRNDQAIVNMLDSLQLDNRPVAWGDIIRKPTAMQPAPHPHPVNDIYGFEYLIDAFNRLGSAITLGDNVAYDQLYKYVDMRIAAQGQNTDQAMQFYLAQI